MNPAQGTPMQGYQKKPVAIGVITAIFLLMPGVWLLQAFTASGGSFAVLRQVLGSGYFLQEWALSWSAAAAVYIVSRWSFVYFVLLSGYVLSARIINLLLRPGLETPVSLVVTIVWVGLVGYFFLSSLRQPYLNPRLRWWTRPTRIPLCREATLHVQGVAIPVTMLNLSTGGAFVRVNQTSDAAQHISHRLGEPVELSVELARPDEPHLAPFRLVARAQLVWMGKPDGPYRDGFGLKFLGLSRSTTQQVQRYLRQHVKISG